MRRLAPRHLGLALTIALQALCGASISAAAETASSSVNVLELYTSQGCSSCPPADALLRSYKDRPDIIALSLPVDYWDRLGWKDTFGSRAYSDRQRDYALGRGDGQVYTPQVVVNGRAHAVGSSASSIDRAIAETARDTRAKQIPMSLALGGTELVVRVTPQKAVSTASRGVLLLASVQNSGTVSIGRGENAGRSVTYHNVVRHLEPIGTWDGAAMTLRVPVSTAHRSCCESLVVLLQSEAGGPLLSAARVALR